MAPDLLQHFKSGETRHLEIEEDQVGLDFRHEFQALGAVAGGRHLAIAAGQHLRAGVEDDFLVVDDQDFVFRLHGGMVSCSLVTGRRMVNVAPLPTWLSTRNGALVLFDNPVTDGQAQTRSMAHLLGGEERVEDPVQVLFADAVAGVGKLHFDGAGPPGRAGSPA